MNQKLLDQYENTKLNEKQEGRAWYKLAHEWCLHTGLQFGLPLDTVSAVVSLLSPRNKWERNKQDASVLISTKLSGGDFNSFSVCTFTGNKRKAWDLLDVGAFDADKVFKGPKTRAFYDNITHRDSSRVTIDTWAYRAAREVELRWRGSITPKMYATLEKEYQAVAKHVGEKPMDLQAILWVVVQNWTKNEELQLRRSKDIISTGPTPKLGAVAAGAA